MCGIAGVVGAAGPDEVVRVAATLELLRSRGPDGAGVAAFADAVLGHRRLAIHDLSPRGLQPFVDPATGIAAVVNGEFYDHAALRAALVADGAVLRGGSDSELLPPSFARRGDAFFADLRGPFAAAVFDPRTRTLTLARDRFGKRPLHYAPLDGALWFASEPGPLARTLGRKPRDDVLVEFLRTGYVRPPRTPFAGVRALGPAEVLTWRIGQGEPTVRRYWTPPFPAEVAAGGAAPTAEDAARLLAEGLADAVRVRLSGERRTGLLLSGGMDSTAVALLMRDMAARAPVAFTGAMDVTAYDESGVAARTAERLGIEHRVVRCDVGAADRLRALVAAGGDLLGDSSALALSAVLDSAREEAPVLLTGDGGDELLLGYERHRAAAFRGTMLRAAAMLGRVPGLRTSDRVAKAAAAAGLPPRLAYAELSALATSRELLARLSPEALGAEDALLAAFAEEPATSDVLADFARLDVLGYLPHDLMTKADRAAGRAGVELRAPFLDPPLADALLALPGALRATPSAGKLPLRAFLVARGFGDVAARRKRGFGVPLASWLTTGPLAALAREALGDVRAPFRDLLKDGSALPLLDDLARGAPVAPLVYACVVAALHHAEYA